jgi:PhnB protein
MSHGNFIRQQQLEPIMQTTATYLQFPGNCREAFAFYAATLGGNVSFSLTYGESPVAAQTPADVRDKIMHARVDIGAQMLLGSDVVHGRYEAPSGFNVMAGVDEPADAERIFQALAAHGTVTMPLQETFWAQRFGICTDRFGVPWMVNCAKPVQAAGAAPQKSAA